LLYTYKKSNKNDDPDSGGKLKYPVTGYAALGKGMLIFSTLETKGFEDHPIFQRFLRDIFTKGGHVLKS
jgi:hypothetical protein